MDRLCEALAVRKFRACSARRCGAPSRFGRSAMEWVCKLPQTGRHPRSFSRDNREVLHTACASTHVHAAPITAIAVFCVFFMYNLLSLGLDQLANAVQANDVSAIGCNLWLSPHVRPSQRISLVCVSTLFQPQGSTAKLQRGTKWTWTSFLTWPLNSRYLCN